MESTYLKRWLMRVWSNKNYRTSAIISFVLIVWLSSGLVSSDDPVARTDNSVQSSGMLVKARYLEQQAYHPHIRIRARTEANRRVSLKTEVEGKVIAIPAQEGQPVKQGDVICELALDDRAIRVEQARSAVNQAQLDYDGALRLKSGGYQSKTAIAGAKARLDSARAELLQKELNLKKLKVRAPFDGVLDLVSVDVGDLMDRGSECGVVLELNPLLIRGRVSETEVVKIKPGDAAVATLLTGEQVVGELSLVGFASDDVTRTFPIEVSVDNSDLSLRGGITTELLVTLFPVSAHLMPSSLLSLNDGGLLGVKVLDDAHKVQFIQVNVIGDHPDGVWVTGLPPRVLIVTLGQEYIAVGDTVDVVVEHTQTDEFSPLETSSSKEISTDNKSAP